VSKSKRSKGQKAQPKVTRGAQYYRNNKAKCAELGRKYRERKRTEKAAAEAAAKAPAPTQRKRGK
jgi:hypothetical protein